MNVAEQNNVTLQVTLSTIGQRHLINSQQEEYLPALIVWLIYQCIADPEQLADTHQTFSFKFHYLRQNKLLWIQIKQANTNMQIKKKSFVPYCPTLTRVCISPKAAKQKCC